MDWWQEATHPESGSLFESMSQFVANLDATNRRVLFMRADPFRGDPPSKRVPSKPRISLAIPIDTPLSVSADFREGGTRISQRIGLVGGLQQRDLGSRLAKDLYESRIYRDRRKFVERSCSQWWILSGIHGLVSPSESVSGGDVSLSRVRRSIRRLWSQEVLLSIWFRITPGGSTTFEFHGSHPYADFGLIQGLEDLGARVERPTSGLSLRNQYEFYEGESTHK
jgi:hypothetical protein